MIEGAEVRPRAAARPDLPVGHLPRPYLLFLGDTVEPGFAKTAFGLRDWAPELCVGEFALPEATVTTGLPKLTPTEAADRGARALVIGVANSGGFIAKSWVPPLLEALEAGLDIVSGMHARLGRHPRARYSAERLGRRLIDIRTPPQDIPVATGLKRSGKRLLTVGTDCALGKKYTALSLARAFEGARHRRGFPGHRPDRDHDLRRRHSDGRGRRGLRRRRRGDAEPRQPRPTIGT